MKRKFDDFQSVLYSLNFCKKKFPDWDFSIPKRNLLFDSIGTKRDKWDKYVFYSFYNSYCFDFHIDFLSEQSSEIDNLILKEWVNFCITQVTKFHDHYTQNFDTDLIGWGSVFGLSPEIFYEKYSSEPDYFYVCQYKFLEFLSKILFDTNSELFITLLFVYQEMYYIDALSALEFGIKTDSDKEEILRTQQHIIINILQFLPEQEKEKGLLQLINWFSKINSFKVFKAPFYLSLDLILYREKVPLEGELFLSWDKVDFYNGFYLLYHPSFLDGDLAHRPFKVIDTNSRIIFSEIKLSFLKRLPPIRVEVNNGRIIKVYNKPHLDLCVSLIKCKLDNPHFKINNFQKSLPNNKKEYTRDEMSVVVKDLKSDYLDFLCLNHLDQYKVICCLENRVYTDHINESEYSFIFTIKESSSKIYLAYENSSDSRCTYIFPILRDKWEYGIERLCEFFSSDLANKRRTLARHLADLNLPGNYPFIRVFHTNYYDWVENIKIATYK